MTPSFRRDRITEPIFRWAQRVLPSLSVTEREAIEAGDVWWDADLFSGNPDWTKLLAFPKARLSPEEQAFLDGPVEELCRMLNEWEINWELCDLPPRVWDFLKTQKFFGMIIPKEYGGLGFSACAHSEIIRKISTRSISGAVTAMVPNSLGPGELLHRFGTKAQQDYWLPRLAAAKEIPCFGLTSPEAGSDAAAMIDSGVVCRGEWQSREVLGIRLNWHKRYITLAPIATVLGLAFKLSDPDHLIGNNVSLGITVALVPTDLPGVEIGRRHLPALHMFQNGPTWGRDVFIPMDHVIGGIEQAGKGWKMLMTALAAGRGISLPSLAAAGTAFAAHVCGAYARIREQFHLPIGRFEAIEERLGRIAATCYLLDAARRLGETIEPERVYDRFHELLPNTIWVLAVLTVAWAAWRRRWAILVLTGGALLWVLAEIAFALHGFPAVPRYMFEAGAVVGILAAIFIGRVVHELPALLAQLVRRVNDAPRLASLVGTWGTVLAVLVISGSMLPAAHRQERLERVDLRHERARTVLIGRLSGVVNRLGASNMFACGQPNIPIEYQSIFAWYAGVKTGVLYVSRPYLAAPTPAGQHLPDRRQRLEGVPQQRRPGPRRRLQQDAPRLPRLMRPCSRSHVSAEQPVAGASR